MSDNLDAATTRQPLTAKSRSAVASLVAACLLAGMMQTIVIPLQSSLPAILDAPRELTPWVITAAAGGAAVFSPISGRAGDMYGRKRIAVSVMILFSLGSLLGALSTNLWLVIAARAIQGIAIGIIPLAISIMHAILPRESQAAAIALASGMLGGGAAFGMPVGALLHDWFGWLAIFIFLLVTGVAITVWIALVVPAMTPPRSGRFDLIGAIGTSLGSGILLLTIGQSLQWGLLSPMTWALALGGLAVLAGTCAWMLRLRDPLIDVRVAMRRPVLLTNVASLMINFANMGANVLLPQLMTYPRAIGLGMTPLTASYIMMISAISQMVATPLVALLARRIGARRMLVLGASGSAFAVLVPVLLGVSALALVLANILMGACFALVFSAFPQIIMSSVPPGQVAEANGLNTQIRTFGTSSGAALIGAVLAAMSAGGDTPLMPFIVGLVICAGTALIGALIGMFIPRRLARTTGFGATPRCGQCS